MELVTIVQIVFVAAAVVTVLALIGAVLDRLRRRVLIGIAFVVGIAAAGAWVAYGLKTRNGDRCGSRWHHDFIRRRARRDPPA